MPLTGDCEVFERGRASLFAREEAAFAALSFRAVFASFAGKNVIRYKIGMLFQPGKQGEMPACDICRNRGLRHGGNQRLLAAGKPRASLPNAMPPRALPALRHRRLAPRGRFQQHPPDLATKSRKGANPRPAKIPYPPHIIGMKGREEARIDEASPDPPGLSGGADPVAEIARRFFGVEWLYPWQRIVMANILDAAKAAGARARLEGGVAEGCGDGETGLVFEDEDGFLRGRQVVILPTGAGKSLCFQVPAMLLPKPTLVIYPLLALMNDQARKLKALGMEPVLFRGGQAAEERDAQFALLKGESCRIIIANPEILSNRKILAAIAERGLSHIAIDEAHCVAEWGDTFRPAYLELKGIIKELAPDTVTAFTATASPPVLARLKDALFGGRAHLVRSSSDRENLFYSVFPCVSKDAALIGLLARAELPAVVFCGTRKGAQRVAGALIDAFPARGVRYYHAGLAREEKAGVERWFSGGGDILCATCAWGMGVDVKNVRTVIHYDPPPTAESYIQEAGRGGRDGLPARAILLWSEADKKRIAAMRGEAARRAAPLVELAESGECRRAILLKALGERGGDAAPMPDGEGERACAGCDICGGGALFSPKEKELAISFLRGNKRRFTQFQAARLLCDGANATARAQCGSHIWRTRDFAAAIESLKKEGRIRECRFFWKERLTVPKSAPP